ncbi:MAG: tRNA 2-thiouridine(34) synthase MnmA [Thermoleophilia bacterium]|nr:tRNA 2-thiouridine(34) synthase MnmA [Thermoleophilia bacterium]MDH4339656.1 tRNA 2-thiouridine(34) synthase MnmA [Thermoleophilia bacterium]MDH5281605.1 tRNA 2-thiouridine(34) synthase MnmA [Thermoleophilia bacterium]
MTTIEVFGDATRGGEWASVRLWVRGDVVVDAHAAGLERSLAGLTLLEAATVSGEPLAVEALASALGQVFVALPEPGRAVVAMSGGVDSAVALLRAAPNAIGVTLRLWQDPGAPDVERACCSPTAVAAARSTCHSLGVPHVTLDLREEFRRAVVQPFSAGYEAGETPNPCIRCNGAFRFDELLAFTSRAGAETLWTGHYARVVERQGKFLIARGVDVRKDQSYMLATLSSDALARVRFPLGEQSKEETRAEAAAAGLAAAGGRESQEACFLGGGDYRDFLAREGLATESGAILDAGGKVLGRHDGYWRFTSGQRRGLGVAATRPLYVLRTEPSSNSVVVGPKEDLAVTRVDAEGALYVPVSRGEAKLRYGSPAVPAVVSAANGGFSLELEEAVNAVARGQVAVVYYDDAVVGAGVITDVA